MKSKFFKNILYMIMIFFISVELCNAETAWEFLYSTTFADPPKSFKCHYKSDDTNGFSIEFLGSSSSLVVTQLKDGVSKTETIFMNKVSNEWPKTEIEYNNKYIVYSSKMDVEQVLSDISAYYKCPQELYMVNFDGQNVYLENSKLYIYYSDPMQKNTNTIKLSVLNDSSEIISLSNTDIYDRGNNDIPIDPYIPENPDPGNHSSANIGKIETKVSWNTTLSALANQGYIMAASSYDGGIKYGEVTDCQLVVSNTDSQFFLKLLGKTEISLNGEKLQACLQSFEDKNNKTYDEIDNYVRQQYANRSYEVVCPNHYSKQYFLKSYNEVKGKNTIYYYGQICVYIKDDQAVIDSLTSDFKSYINMLISAGNEKKCSEVFDNTASKRNSLISQYNQIKKDLGDKQFDFSKLEEIYSDLKNIDCSRIVNYINPPKNVEIPKHSCKSIFGDPKAASKDTPAYYMSFAFKVIMWLSIVILVAASVIDFISAISSSDDDQLSKVIKRIGTRVALCVLLFLLPMLIDYLLSLLDQTSISECLDIVK